MELIWPVLFIGDTWFDMPVILAWLVTGFVAWIVLEVGILAIALKLIKR